MDQETHPYQVSVWIPGNDNPKSIFERSLWVEMARCITDKRAEEIAQLLSLHYSSGVQVAKIDETGQIVGYKYIPDSARNLKK